MQYLITDDKYEALSTLSQADFENALRQIYQESLNSNLENNATSCNIKGE